MTSSKRDEATLPTRQGRRTPRCRNTSSDALQANGRSDTREATRRLLSEHVREKLSAEMEPSAFLLLDALPRNADGTVNRDALAARSDVS